MLGEPPRLTLIRFHVQVVPDLHTTPTVVVRLPSQSPVTPGQPALPKLNWLLGERPRLTLIRLQVAWLAACAGAAASGSTSRNPSPVAASRRTRRSLSIAVPLSFWRADRRAGRIGQHRVHPVGV